MVNGTGGVFTGYCMHLYGAERGGAIGWAAERETNRPQCSDGVSGSEMCVEKHVTRCVFNNNGF